jgi:hypothetical protein
MIGILTKGLGAKKCQTNAMILGVFSLFVCGPIIYDVVEKGHPKDYTGYSRSDVVEENPNLNFIYVNVSGYGVVVNDTLKLEKIEVIPNVKLSNIAPEIYVNVEYLGDDV